MYKFLYWLKAQVFGLLNMRMWVRNTMYDQALDEWFQACLSEDVLFTDIGEYTAKLKGVLVWISNYPYASFTVGGSGLPSRYTAYRLQKHLMRSRIQEYIK